MRGANKTTFSGPVVTGAFTVATSPKPTTESTLAGAIAYFTDGANGSQCLAFYDGFLWRRADDNQPISLVAGFLLDQYPGAAAAYSTRQIRADAGPSPLRIRRASDNIEVDVPFGASTALGTTDMEGFLKSYTGGFGTNLLLYSEEFDNGYWVKQNVSVTPNASASPIGTITADRLTSSGGIYPGFFRSINITNGVSYVFSVYYSVVNQATVPDQVLPSGLTIQRGVYLDPLFGGGGGLTIDAASNIDALVAPGIYRRSIRVTATATQARVIGVGFVDNIATGATAAGRAYDFWGIQFEATTALTPTTYDYKRDTANTSAFVTTWYDQSGNARNATQATAANQPRIVNAGVVDKVNGRVAPTFTSISMGLTVNPLSSANFHVFSVANLSAISGANAAYVHDGVDTVTRPYWLRDAGGKEDPGVGSALLVPGGLVARSRLYPTGGSYRNSVLFQSAAQSIGTGVNGLTIGNRFSLTEPAGGGIPELVAYFTDQSANRAAIESNIMSYYSIA